MKNKKTIIILSVAVLILALVVMLFSKGLVSMPTSMNESNATLEGSADPLTVTLDFYDQWLDTLQATDTDPYKAGLATSPVLSDMLKSTLASAKDKKGLDPVICQNPIPEKLNAKIIYSQDGKAQVLVLTKKQNTAGQAIVSLVQKGATWQIDNVVCSLGEFEAPREFTFEYEGHILKDVPPPLDKNFWYLVYTQENTPGYVAKLFFSATSSKCTSLEGADSICSPDSFTQAKKVKLQGNMTEYGVDVSTIKFLE